MTTKPDSGKQSGLILEIEGGCATITLNRPERHNALSQQDMDDLCETLEVVNANVELRVLILTGTGEKSFCSGAFLGDLADRKFKGDPLQRLAETLENMRLITICAFNGSVYGGGVEVSLCCDFRIGVEGMRMFVPPARLGIHYPEKGLQRFISRLGLGVTKRILLAIETFQSHTLVDIGFVDYLVQRDNLQERSHKLAAELMQLAPLSLETMKATLNEIARGEVDADKVRSRISLCAKSVDHQEAMRARAEKRPAVFTRQ
ncbi:MAG: enoyl-CoA hydratase/isomerase family protein [Pseudomonadales bacterium]|nr:enoyl-CoA hydratase/isomerase family protein [Pseudomonadales bacterium]